MTGSYWEIMYTDLLKRVDAGEFSGKLAAPPQRPADALRLLADLFSESVHETWTRGEIINVIEDAIALGSSHARPERCGGAE